MKPRVPLPSPLDYLPFATRDAATAGVGRGRLRGGDLQHPFRGTNTPSTEPLTLDARCRTLQTRLPVSSFFCGVTAAALWGAPLPRFAETGDLHVGVPIGTAPTGRGLKGHLLPLRPGEMVTRLGLRLTSPARTWIDLGSVLSLVDLVAVGDFLIHHAAPLTGRSDLQLIVGELGGRRGIRNLRAALPLLSERSESRRETRLRLILLECGLDGLEANFWILTSDGVKYRADIAFPNQKVIVEYQSAFHETPERQHADMIRRGRLQADGWLVIEVSRVDLLDEASMVRRIRRTLANRSR